MLESLDETPREKAGASEDAEIGEDIAEEYRIIPHLGCV
jgi:hypothetical protein